MSAPLSKKMFTESRRTIEREAIEVTGKGKGKDKGKSKRMVGRSVDTETSPTSLGKRPRHDDPPPIPQKKQLQVKVKTPQVGLGSMTAQRMSSQYSSKEKITTVEKSNVQQALNALNSEDWQDFNWTDPNVYGCFSEYITEPEEYLKSVQRGGMDAIYALSRALAGTSEKFNEEYQARLYVLRSLAGLNLAKNSEFGKHPALKAVRLSLKKHRLEPETWPSRKKIDTNVDNFFTLFTDLHDMTVFERWFNSKLSNDYGTANTLVDSQLAQWNEEWEGEGVEELEKENSIKVRELLKDFPNAPTGAVIFALLTINPDEYEGVLPETKLRRDLCECFRSNWNDFESGMKNSISLFCIQYLRMNPLPSVQHRSAKKPDRGSMAHYSGQRHSPQEATAQRLYNAINEKAIRQKFYNLPWADPYFLAGLTKVFQGDQKASLQAKSTNANKGVYFVDSILLPSLNSNDLTTYNNFIQGLSKAKDWSIVRQLTQRLEEARQKTSSSSEESEESEESEVPFSLTKSGTKELVKEHNVEFLINLNSDDPYIFGLFKKYDMLPLGIGDIAQSKPTKADRTAYLLTQWELDPGYMTRLYKILKQTAKDYPPHKELLKCFPKE